MHIITSQSAGVLHVPACKHDSPPPAGIYFLCTCAVYCITILTGCAYRPPEAVQASVRAIYCNGYNEENQAPENQYFHAAQAYS